MAREDEKERRRKGETEKEEQLDANGWEKDENGLASSRCTAAVAREKKGDVLRRK